MTTNAVERAEKMLDRWQTTLSGVSKDAPVAATPAGPKPAAPKPRSGGLMRVAATGYVALAAKTQALVDPVRQSWQQNVGEARQAQQAHVAATQGPAAARRVADQEKRGEQTLKITADDTAEVAGTAGDAAGA